MVGFRLRVTRGNDGNVVAIGDQRLGEIPGVLLSAAGDIPGIRAHHADSHDHSRQRPHAGGPFGSPGLGDDSTGYLKAFLI
jgi:hypothetical protein